MASLDSGFFQIPHWLPSGSGLASLLVHKVQGEFLRAPLPSPTCSLLPRAMAGFAPASRLACRSHVAGVPPSPCVPNCACVPRTWVWHPLADTDTSSPCLPVSAKPFSLADMGVLAHMDQSRALPNPCASRQSLHPQQSAHRSAGWEADPIGFRADIGGGLSAGRLPRAMRSRLRYIQLDPRRKESKHTDHWRVPAEPVREGSDTSFLGAAVTAILSGVGVPQRH